MASALTSGDPPVTVVKLGGSHALESHFHTWVAALARCGGRVVVVPGGGLFADAVRRAQQTIGFDDRAAHHMALLAMEQFGVAIASVHDVLVTASSESKIRSAAAAGRVPVWLPTSMVLGEPRLPPSWDLTSDSLAAWLALRLDAAGLILVKHRVVDDRRDLLQPGMVDCLFDTFAQDLPCVRLLDAADAGKLAEAVFGCDA